MQKHHSRGNRRRAALHHLLTAILTITVLAFLQGCGGGGSSGGGVGYSGDNSSGTATAASVPQVGTVNNLSSSGQPVRPGDWIEVNGSNFGTTQGTSYVGFTNGTTTSQASLYDSWSDSKIVCRVPDGAPMTKRYAVREITQIFVSKSGTGNSDTFSTSSDPTPNPSPQPTPPGPTPTPSPTSTATPTPTPTTTPTPTPTPTQTGGGSSGGGGGVGPAAKLGFKVNPTDVTAGQAITPSVEVEILDANGNRVTTATNEITISLNDIEKTGAVLSPPVIKTHSGTLTRELSGDVKKVAVNGVAVFDNLSVDKTGEGYTLKAASGTLTEVTSGAFTVNPGAAHHFFFNTQPVNGTINVAMTNIVVYVVDALGNLVTSDNETMVKLGIKTGPEDSVITGGDAKQVVGGIATFDNVTLNKTGKYTLNAEDGAEEPVITEAVSNQFTIFAQGVDHPAFIQQPTGPVAGVVINPAVTVGIYNNEETLLVDDNVTEVTIAIKTGPEGATLLGGGAVQVVNGVATFNALTLDKAGEYTLEASFAGNTKTATSAAFTVTHSVANKLQFSQNPPETVEEGAAINPAVTVQILDQYGNLVNTGDDAELAVTLTINKSGSLGGTAIQNGVAGIATFGDLTVTPGNVGYILTAGSGELTGANSTAFDVTAFITMVTSFSSAPGDVNNPEKTAGGNANFIPNGDAGTKVQLISAAKFGEEKGQVFFVGPTGTETEAVADDIIWTDVLIECKVPANAEIGVGTIKVKPTAGGSYTKPFVTCPDGMTYIPAGQQGGADIPAFFMSECEITNTEFCAFLNAQGNQTEGGVTWWDAAGTTTPETNGIEDKGELENPRYAVKAGFENRPVCFVSWYGATAYCTWKANGTRLAQNMGAETQSEWEYAYRSGTTTDYYWGELFDNEEGAQGGDYCWYTGNCTGEGATTHDTGTRIPNAWGLYDMGGNVTEWCNEIYISEGSFNNGNPYIRGGAYDGAGTACTAIWNTFVMAKKDRFADIGFRVVRPLP